MRFEPLRITPGPGRRIFRAFEQLYTRKVTRLRQQGLTLLVAAVLAGVPVWGSVCMAMCAPAPAAAARAGSSEGDHTAHCEDASSTAVSLGVSSLHSCGRHDGPYVGGTVAVAAGRADAGAVMIAIGLGNVTGSPFGSPIALLQASPYSPPISPPSPTRAPLVLRI